jgi:hypothetical protein
MIIGCWHLHRTLPQCLVSEVHQQPTSSACPNTGSPAYQHCCCCSCCWVSRYFQRGTIELTTLGNFGRTSVAHNRDGADNITISGKGEAGQPVPCKAAVALWKAVTADLAAGAVLSQEQGGVPRRWQYQQVQEIAAWLLCACAPCNAFDRCGCILTTGGKACVRLCLRHSNVFNCLQSVLKNCAGQAAWQVSL